MGRRLLRSINSADGSLQSRVYRDSDLAEYVVTFRRDGVRDPSCDYHTQDKADAFQVAWTHTGGAGPCPPVPHKVRTK